ncbi:MAG: CCA tRNA nucleotidyltransferase [Rickettsiaceae bacterium]|nr:CCA tRNA nucleotidyltransferase [Rickettsiaceae bacterium]
MIKQKLNFNSKELIEIFKICQNAGVEIRVVGGAVRDILLGHQIIDFDLAIKLPPQKSLKLFADNGYIVIPTGINYGTITVLVNDTPFQITSLRKDIKTDGRRAQVEYGTSFEEDAIRRDFTINSLSYDIITENLYDYFGGVEDLQNRKVIFIGDAEKRIREDYLRILRFFRFSAYYSKDIDPKGFYACAKLAKELDIISPERIYQEISKIMSCPKNISHVIKFMHETSIWKFINPAFAEGIDDLLKLEDFVFGEEISIAQDFVDLKIIRFAFCSYNFGIERTSQELHRLKFPRYEIVKINLIHKFINSIIDLDSKQDIYFQICKEWYYHQSQIDNLLFASLILNKIDKESFFKGLQEMSCAPPLMPVSSAELMKLGYTNLALGIRKKYLEEKWIESGFTISKENLINLK